MCTCKCIKYPVPTPTNALRKFFQKCGFSSFIFQTTIFYNLHLEVGHCTLVYDSFMTLYFMTEWLHPFSILRWFRVYRLRWLHQWPVAVSPLLLVSDENTGDGCCVPSLLPHTMPASADTHGGIHSSDNAITLETSR